MATELVLVTERERQEPMLALIQQLRRLGFVVHVIPRATYNHVSRVPTPRVVLIDAGGREWRASEQSPQPLAAWEYVPVVLLAQQSELERLRFAPALHDFIILPATPAELEARMRFALWKSQGTPDIREHFEGDGLRINLHSHEVWAENRRVELTYKEFELLKFLVTHRRRVFTRAELLEQVWESDYFGGTRTVDVHIRRLRAKLGGRAGNLIQTVRNVGYRFG